MIETPIEQLPDARLASEEDYAAWFERIMAIKAADGFPLDRVVSPNQVFAYVNHSRWVVDCQCGAGVAVHPDWQRAFCICCGATHTAIRFPESAVLAEIVDVLDARPKKNRNWTVAESVTTLKAENVERGVSVSASADLTKRVEGN